MLLGDGPLRGDLETLAAGLASPTGSCSPASLRTSDRSSPRASRSSCAVVARASRDRSWRLSPSRFRSSPRPPAAIASWSATPAGSSTIGDIDGLAQAMDWLIDHPAERRAMGERAGSGWSTVRPAGSSAGCTRRSTRRCWPTGRRRPWRDRRTWPAKQTAIERRRRLGQRPPARSRPTCARAARPSRSRRPGSAASSATADARPSDIALRDQDPVHVRGQDLGRPTDRRGDDRKPAGGGLEDRRSAGPPNPTPGRRCRTPDTGCGRRRPGRAGRRCLPRPRRSIVCFEVGPERALADEHVAQAAVRSWRSWSATVSRTADPCPACSWRHSQRPPDCRRIPRPAGALARRIRVARCREHRVRDDPDAFGRPIPSISTGLRGRDPGIRHDDRHPSCGHRRQQAAHAGLVGVDVAQRASSADQHRNPREGLAERREDHRRDQPGIDDVDVGGQGPVAAEGAEGHGQAAETDPGATGHDRARGRARGRRPPRPRRPGRRVPTAGGIGPRMTTWQRLRPG